jgi:hypothetical protein
MLGYNMRGTERKTENLKIKKKIKKLDRKKNWRGGRIIRKRERRSEREGDFFKKNMKRERNSESEGELKKMEDERGRVSQHRIEYFPTMFQILL